MLAKSERLESPSLFLPIGRFVFTRFFERPRDLLFEAWTEARAVRNCGAVMARVISVCEIRAKPRGKSVAHRHANA